MEKKEPYYIFGRNVTWCIDYEKTILRLLKKLKVELLYDPAIPLLGMYPKKTKHSKTYLNPSVHSNISYNTQDIKIT